MDETEATVFDLEIAMLQLRQIKLVIDKRLEGQGMNDTRGRILNSLEDAHGQLTRAINVLQNDARNEEVRSLGKCKAPDCVLPVNHAGACQDSKGFRYGRGRK